MDNESTQNICSEDAMTEVFRLAKIRLIKAVRDASEGSMGLLDAKRFVERMQAAHEVDQKVAVLVRAYHSLGSVQAQKKFEDSIGLVHINRW